MSPTMSKRSAQGVPKNTRYSTEYWLRILDQFCLSGDQPFGVVDFKTVTSEKLCDILSSFYANVKKKDGSGFAKNSLQSARGVIQRHISSFSRQINIFTDPACWRHPR